MSNILDREDFIRRLKAMGYEPTHAGFRQCILDRIEDKPLAFIAEELDVTKNTLRDWMKRLHIKNPHGPGGNNNPGGCYGKKKFRRNINKGCIWKEG